MEAPERTIQVVPRGGRRVPAGALALAVAVLAAGCGEPDPVLTRPEPGVVCADDTGSGPPIPDRTPEPRGPDALERLLDDATWVVWGEVAEIVPPDDGRPALVTVVADALLVGPCAAERVTVSVPGRLGVGVGSGAVVIAHGRERPQALAPLDAFGVEDLEEAYAVDLVDVDRHELPPDQEPCLDATAPPRAEPFPRPRDPAIAALVGDIAWVVLGRVASDDRADARSEGDPVRVVLAVDRVLRGGCDLASIEAVASAPVPASDAPRIFVLEFGIAGFEVTATPDAPPTPRWEAEFER